MSGSNISPPQRKNSGGGAGNAAKNTPPSSTNKPIKPPVKQTMPNALLIKPAVIIPTDNLALTPNAASPEAIKDAYLKQLDNDRRLFQREMEALRGEKDTLILQLQTERAERTKDRVKFDEQMTIMSAQIQAIQSYPCFAEFTGDLSRTSSTSNISATDQLRTSKKKRTENDMPLVDLGNEDDDHMDNGVPSHLTKYRKKNADIQKQLAQLQTSLSFLQATLCMPLAPPPCTG